MMASVMMLFSFPMVKMGKFTYFKVVLQIANTPEDFSVWK